MIKLQIYLSFLLTVRTSRICCKSTVSEDIHEHPLKLIKNSRTPYKCDGCKELGFGSSYRCIKFESRPIECHYQLHEECRTSALANSATTPSLFSENVYFIFHEQSPEHVGSCVACGKDVQGFRYHYSPPKKNAFVELFFPSKQLVLHPCCFKLPSTRTNQGLNASNEGVVNLELKEKAASKCLICQKNKISNKIEGWAYVSTCGEYCYHVKCVKDLVDKKLEQRSDGTNTSTLRLEVRQKALKVGKDIAEVVLMLIVQAIFGDPISAIVTLILKFLQTE